MRVMGRSISCHWVSANCCRSGARCSSSSRTRFVAQSAYDGVRHRSEPLEIHAVGDEEYRLEMVRELMALVGLDPRFLNRYPHSFSGGQRQRIGIARRWRFEPKLLICDEPVSALDVSVQAQILNCSRICKRSLGPYLLFSPTTSRWSTTWRTASR